MIEYRDTERPPFLMDSYFWILDSFRDSAQLNERFESKKVCLETQGSERNGKAEGVMSVITTPL